MTLKELSSYFRDNQNNADMCEHYKNQYLLENQDKFEYEDLSESDIAGLRPYLMCWVLAIYEYMARCSCTQLEDWFDNYSDVSCKRLDNDYYLELIETQKSIFPDREPNADRVFDLMYENSLPEFARRGIPLSKLYDIA